jgi:hypothetical protein
MKLEESTDGELIKIINDTSSIYNETVKIQAKVILHSREKKIALSTRTMTLWILFFTVVIAFLTIVLVYLETEN